MYTNNIQQLIINSNYKMRSEVLRNKEEEEEEEEKEEEEEEEGGSNLQLLKIAALIERL